MRQRTRTNNYVTYVRNFCSLSPLMPVMVWNWETAVTSFPLKHLKCLPLGPLLSWVWTPLVSNPVFRTVIRVMLGRLLRVTTLLTMNILGRLGRARLGSILIWLVWLRLVLSRVVNRVFSGDVRIFVV